jgi:hypothetical protein
VAAAKWQEPALVEIPSSGHITSSMGQSQHCKRSTVRFLREDVRRCGGITRSSGETDHDEILGSLTTTTVKVHFGLPSGSLDFMVDRLISHSGVSGNVLPWLTMLWYVSPTLLLYLVTPLG